MVEDVLRRLLGPTESQYEIGKHVVGRLYQYLEGDQDSERGEHRINDIEILRAGAIYLSHLGTI